MYKDYCQTCNISHTLAGNIIVDHSDVVGVSRIGAAPPTSSFSTYHLTSMDWIKTTAEPDEKHLSLGFWCALYLWFDSTFSVIWRRMRQFIFILIMGILCQSDVININLLWPNYAIWRQRSGSTLPQVMACCLMAPSHYLNQCWLLISEVLWHWPESNFHKCSWT